MKQHINFLKSTPEEKLRFPAKWIILSIISSLVLVMIISLYLIAHHASIYIQLRQAHNKHDQSSTLFQETARRYPLLASEIPLVLQIATLEKVLKEKKNSFEAITGSSLRYGFSNYLEILANVVPEGLWIKKIVIDQEKKTATINGFMVKPVDVSVLLQALQRSPIFDRTLFNVFYIKDIPDKTYTEFHLTNEAIKQQGT